MTKEELVNSAVVPLLSPKETEINGCQYRLGKYPATAGREILSKVPMGLAAGGAEYSVSEEAMFLVFRFIERVTDTGAGVRLVTRELIDSHVPDAGTLLMLEEASLEYNLSFFPKGSASASLKDLLQIINPRPTGT